MASGSMVGGLSSRFNLYVASLDTFFEHPWGVGPGYTYVDYENGIGYHSQFLDDLARYGILALLFYIAFFVGYYKLLRKQWSKINLQQIAFPVVIIYFLFLIFNPGFTSPHEGVLLLFLIPAFPDIYPKNEIGTQSTKKHLRGE
jgi:O-antigen ligase